MKISAISSTYPNASGISASKSGALKESQNVPKLKTSTISFRSGNPYHVLHVLAECKPYGQAGGVGTVGQDYTELINLLIESIEKGQTVQKDGGMSAFVMPYYNGMVTYDKNGMKKGVEVCRVPMNLPEGHKLKGKEGQYVFLGKDLGASSLVDALSGESKYWLLEEVSSKTMTWGLEENAPVKLLRVVQGYDGKVPKRPFYFVFTEATAFDPSPYSDGSYSSGAKKMVNSWNGDPYPKFDKATVECMEDLVKNVGNGYDPGTVVCSDSQAAFTTHYMAQKVAAGSKFYEGKKPIQIGHNISDGYIGITSPRNMLVNLDLMTPKELKAVINSKEFAEAVAGGEYTETKFYEKYLKGMQATNKCSAMSVPMHYAKTGYLQTFAVVSQGYLDDITKIDEITPYLYEDVKELKEKGIAVGFTNPLNSKESAFSSVGVGGYAKDSRITLKDGTVKTFSKMEMLDIKEKASLTPEKVKEFKRKAKINFFERFLPEYNLDNVVSVESFNVNDNKWSPVKNKNLFRAGAESDLILEQEIDVKKYLEMLKKGEDVKVVVSWGRGDFQKAFDEVLMSFKKYVKKTGDKNTLLVMGGDLTNDKVEGQKVKDLAELMSKDPDLKGRVMLMNGFSPGNPMGWMGDLALFPSRMAPCELTDLEAKKFFTPPLVPDGQGMGQKNYDPSNSNEWEKADAFKTKHQYFTPVKEMAEAAKETNSEAYEAYNKVYKTSVNTIKTRYKFKLGKELTEEEIQDVLKGKTGALDKKVKNAVENYSDAVRKLRDEVMSDELAETMDRALNKTDKKDLQKIFENHRDMKTGWEENQRIINSEKPVGQMYRDAFGKPAKNITSDNVIGYGIEKPDLSGAVKKGGIGSKLRHFAGKPAGRWTIGLSATALVAGAAYALVHKKGAPEEKAKEKESDNLALIG